MSELMAVGQALTGGIHMTTQVKADRTSRQTIMDAIQELTGLGHSLTRDNLQAATGLTMHIIDDHVSRMVDVEGVLRRVRPGVYELVMGVGKMPSVHFSDLDGGKRQHDRCERSSWYPGLRISADGGCRHGRAVRVDGNAGSARRQAGRV